MIPNLHLLELIRLVFKTYVLLLFLLNFDFSICVFSVLMIYNGIIRTIHMKFQLNLLICLITYFHTLKFPFYFPMCYNMYINTFKLKYD